MRSKAKRMRAELFQIFLRAPDTRPGPWRQDASQANEARRARIVCDYIAGMTDSYAIEEHRRLYHPDVLR